MTGLKSLPKWQGKAYRGYTGYENKNLSAFDVIKFESIELGNYKDFKHLTEEILNELHQYPAKNITWVTKSKQIARHYGDVYEVEDIQNARIIAEDGDNGYLILKMKAR
jgi:hypothetical protein